jgi:hypothetical protein
VTTAELIAGYFLIGMVAILFITVLIKTVKREQFSEADRRLPFIITGALLIYVVLLAVHYTTGISNSDRLQILLQLGLVSITAVYTWLARQQAEANVKMAEEMKKQSADSAEQAKASMELAKSAQAQAEASKLMANEMQEQRYDLFRPVINIEVARSSIAFENQKLFYANTTPGARDLPNELICVLHNVGLGPAIDIYSYFRVGDKEGCEQRPIGTLSKDSKSDEKLLAVQKQGMNNGLLLVIYRDAYGRYFTSKREIYHGADESGLKLVISLLQPSKLTKGEEEKEINEALKDVEIQIR